MTIHKIIFAFAGLMVLLSTIAGVVYSPGWLLVTAFVGGNLLQYAFTGWCPLAVVLERLGFTFE